MVFLGEQPFAPANLQNGKDWEHVDVDLDAMGAERYDVTGVFLWSRGTLRNGDAARRRWVRVIRAPVGMGRVRLGGPRTQCEQQPSSGHTSPPVLVEPLELPEPPVRPEESSLPPDDDPVPPVDVDELEDASVVAEVVESPSPELGQPAQMPNAPMTTALCPR